MTEPKRWSLVAMEPKWRAFAAMGTSYIVIVFGTTLSFIVLSPIAEDFDVGLGAVGWTVIIEALIVSALVLPLGALADALGRRRVMLTGMVIFAAGAALSAVAPTFVLLLGARTVMAIGNALVQAIGTGILVAAFPPEERGLAIGSQTTAVAVGAAIGPLLGGFGLAVMSWNALFLILAAAAALSVVLIAAAIPADEATGQTERPSFDYAGSALAAIGITLVVVVLNNPFGLSWLSLVTLVLVALTVVVFVIFVRWELRHDNPMLELRLFAIDAFRRSALVRIIGFSGSSAATLLLPVYVLSVREASEAAVGLVLFGFAVGMAVGAQLSGRVYDRVGPRPSSLAGLILQIGLCLFLAVAGTEIGLLPLGLINAALGLGVAMWNVPNNSNILGATPPESFGVGGAFTNLTRTMGNVISQALTAGIVVAVMAGQGFDIPLGDVADTAGAVPSFVDGWTVAFYTAAAITAVALLVALRLRAPAPRDDAVRAPT